MTGDVRDLLPLYVLGMLESDEVMVVERAVAADAAIAAELAAFQQTADAIGVAIQPVAPSPDVKQRLFASVGGGRFEAFSARLAKLFDVTVDRARELLGLIERPASWVPHIPGVSVVHFDGGPATATADCGFVRLTPGAVIPPHTHLGEEAVTVLSGRIQDVTNDCVLVAGDDYVQLEGTNHYQVCVGEEDCILALRAMNGAAVGGATVGGSRARPQKN